MSAMTTAPAAGVRPPGYHLPDATVIGRVRLQVGDLARSLAWYEGTLGLRVLERDVSRATLGAHGDDIPFLELVERPGARAVPRRGLLGLYHVAILLPDRRALGRFVAHLSRTQTRAGASDHLVSEALYLYDPDGLGIEVYVDRPREEWRVRNGEIEMTTIPLDLGALVRAAGGDAWTGMPAGTRVGHVHLSVADLATASAFYHETLGFDRMVWSYPGALFMGAGGYHHHLGTNTWAAESPVAGEGDARLLEWELQLPARSDVDAAAAAIEGAGHGIEREGDDVVVRDPLGIRVRLSARG
jgi:catechol 2,3-dioxygenase